MENEIKNNEKYLQYKNIIPIKKKLSKLKNTNAKLENIKEEASFLKEFARNVSDKNIKCDDDLHKYALNTNKKIQDMEHLSMFREEDDDKNAYLDIKAGAGGIDAQDWSNMLLKMYYQWGIKKKYNVKILYKKYADIAGIKEATIKFEGGFAYGWLKTENGIHRLVRKSPFNNGKKRHTSFSSIFIYPDIGEKINEIDLKISDLKIDTYRAGGAGGQHVNRTESAVRITHIPTDITVQCQNERSQHQNKNQAIKELKKKIHGYNLLLKKKIKQKIENEKLCISWSNQIRSYILDDGYIKDLRTGDKTSKITSFLNGNIDSFIKNNLKLNT